MSRTNVDLPAQTVKKKYIYIYMYIYIYTHTYGFEIKLLHLKEAFSRVRTWNGRLQLVGWLVGLLVGWFFGWLVGWLVI